MKKCFPLLMLFLTMLGCASSSEVADARRDITTVYQDLRSYKDSTDARLSKLEKEVSTLSQSVRSVEELTRKQYIDLSMSLEGNDDKIKTILGRLDELDSRLRTYRAETKGELKEPKNARSTATQQDKGLTVAQGNYEESYKQGFDAFQKGLYEDSIRAFSNFVQTYPDAPLAANARYWMGEAYMNLKDQEKAIVQFQEVVERFPKSEKAARAMLRQAEAFAALGDKKDSTTLLKKIVESFPKSEEAKLAERMLRGGTL